MDTITGFAVASDKLSFSAMTGITATAGTAVTTTTNATNGAVYVMTADTSINGDTIDYSKIGTTVNNATVTLTDASVMADVAAYIANALSKEAADENYVAVINDNNNNAYAYLVNVGSDGVITADDLTLIGTITADADITTGAIA
ncbi:hypothetical protein NG754_10830 [Aliarcobacter cryaerophilus]|uniref:hypothetical protein n=1 Tax=Aliarcobacter cryaerophilus TaxID=28198 RepID=UPI003DA43E97